MNVLWKLESATARDIAGGLPEDISWAYTTIKTMLSRLESKGAVSETKKGNTSVYEPLVSRAQARKSAVISLLEQAFDGTVAPLLSFLAEDRKLTEKQKKELREILEAENPRETEE